MEAIFTADSKNGKLHYTNTEDLFKFCMEHDGELIHVAMRPLAKTSEKMRMYAYLFGPVMFCAVQGFTAAGYEMMDKVKARYMLEAQCAKAEIYNSKTQKIEVYTESIAGMTKTRLYKFIVDVLFFLEAELGQRVPDSEEWKVK